MGPFWRTGPSGIHFSVNFQDLRISWKFMGKIRDLVGTMSSLMKNHGFFWEILFRPKFSEENFGRGISSQPRGIHFSVNFLTEKNFFWFFRKISEKIFLARERRDIVPILQFLQKSTSRASRDFLQFCKKFSRARNVAPLAPFFNFFPFLIFHYYIIIK